MKPLLIKAIQTAMNRYVALDPFAVKRLATLQSRVVMIELLGLGLTMQLRFDKQTIHVMTDHFVEADTVIRSAPFSLLHMALTRQHRHRFFGESVVIEGNLDVAQDVMALFDELEIDWEEHLSRWVGDVPAYQSGRVIHRIKQMGRRLQQTFKQSLNEYVHEEIHLAPALEALEDFYHDVDQLRMDVDRVDAKIARLEKAIRGDA